MRRAIVLVAAAVLTVVVAIPALANHYSFEVTVDGTATLNQFKTVLTITGTYTCDAPGFDTDNSGFGGAAFQETKGGKYVVQGDFGIGGDQLTCDGTPQDWTLYAQAYVDDEPAVWKNGRVIVNVGGNVCDSDCTHEAGDGQVRSVKITK